MLVHGRHLVHWNESFRGRWAIATKDLLQRNSARPTPILNVRLWLRLMKSSNLCEISMSAIGSSRRNRFFLWMRKLALKR